MSNFLVLGYFGYKTNKLDGKTVRTRDINRLAKKYAADGEVDYYDTQELQTSKLSIFKMFWKLI